MVAVGKLRLGRKLGGVGVLLPEPPFPSAPQVVEDERSDREETDNSEEEEEVAKNGPLSNGHPVLNNNHRKTD